MSPILALLVSLVAAEPAPAPVVVPPSLAQPLVIPSALPMRRDTMRTVIVELTVGVDGRATDIAIVSDTPPQLAEVARAVIAGALFRPATRDGTPIAARIKAPVAFGTAKSMLAGVRRDLETPPLEASGVRGRVLERGTRRPVAGIGVVLGGVNPVETVTDENGRFAFPNLPRGVYEVEVPFFADDSARATVRVAGEDGASATLRITPGQLGTYVTRVSDDRQRLSDSSRVEIPMERAREVPGSSGDPLKVIESLPGVARPAAAGPGAGQLIIRGSAPEDSRFYIDGLPLFQLYHFGNIFSVVQDEWIESIDFRPGGYSTQFGNATGGMVNVTLKDLAKDGAHGHGDANIYHVAGLVTVPVSKEWTLGVAARRSWVDAILGGIVNQDGGFQFTSAPRYYDYQVRADYHPKGGAKLRLLAFGSDDDLVVFGGAPGATDVNANNFALSRSFHQIQGTLQVPLSRTLGFTAGLSTSYQKFRVTPGSNDFQLTFDPVVLQSDLSWRPSSEVQIKAGVYGEVQRFKVDLRSPLPTKEGEVQLPTEVRQVFEVTESGFSGRADIWGEATWQPSRELSLLAGARLLSWHGNFSAVAPDMRAAVGWSPTTDWGFVLSGGLNHQAPAPDESASTIGSQNLSPERAAYLNLAVTKRIGTIFSAEFEGFYKALDQLVVATGQPDPYDNAGAGSVIGAQALLRLQHPILDGWISYTLSRSRRTDRPGEPERYFSFDQTHVLAVVAGVQLGAGWRFGARVRYATGNPFTPLEPAYFDAGSDVWIPRAAGAPLSGRAGGFFQLDVRFDKTFIFDLWRLALYLELNNATNRANIESIGYSDDYQRRNDITSLPLTPSLGIRGSF